MRSDDFTSGDCILPEPMQLPDCYRFSLSAVESRSAYEIYVHVPDCPTPATGFPVVYLLDANADFLLVVEAMRRLSRRPGATGVAPAIVVGVGYPRTSAYGVERRHYDMTAGPPADDDFARSQDLTYGGQTAFLDFIKGRLRRVINGRYSTDPTHNILIGHSLAGYFVLEALAREPDVFAAYAAVSPSIWWDPSRLDAAIVKAAEKNGTEGVRLYAAVGSYEEELAPWQASIRAPSSYTVLRRSRRMVENTRQFCDRISDLFEERANVRFDLAQGEDHASVFIACLGRALRFTLGGKRRTR
ncbi:alpha/beta hydrolase [Rhizobium sp. PAMB 3182]